MKKLLFYLSLLQASMVLTMQKDIKEYIGDYCKLISMINKINALSKLYNPGYVLEVSDDVTFDFTGYQTKQGFFLEFKHGAPKSIYWKLGRAKFAKGFTAQIVEDETKFLEHLKQHFGFEKQQEFIEYRDITSRASALLCPMNTHNELQLPQAVLRLREKQECIPEETARKIYKEITRH